MSRTIAKLLLSILLMPLMAVLYIASMVIVERSVGWRNESFVFTIAGLVTAVISLGYWYLVWRSSVVWTPRRIGATLGAVCGATVFGGVIAVVVERLMMEEGFGVFLGSSFGMLACLIASVFVWRESSAERAARLAKLGIGAVACPACGYNLTGLKTTTCPECGGSFSIQELAASARGVGELES